MRKLLLLTILLIAFFSLAPDARAAVLSKAPNNLGLVGYWGFDEGTGTLAGDASGNSNTGTISGATWTEGKRGKALSFVNGGLEQRVSTSVASFNTSLTISAWVYPTHAPSERFTVVIGYGSGYYLSLASDLSAQTYWYGKSSEGYHSSGSNTVPLNQWSFISTVWDGSTAKMYVNGDLKSTTASTGTGNSGTSVVIGAEDTNRQFRGKIDDVRIYNRALSATDISNLYRSGQVTRKAPTDLGLVGYWAFDEARGTIAGDSSGKGNHATITNATWADGKRGKALSFNGSNTYVTSPTISIADTITASAWVYSTNFSQNGFVIGKNNVNEQWELFFETVLRWRGGATVNNDAYCDTPANNQWHHIAATQTGTSAILYLNGVQCDTGTMPAIANGSGTIDIGRFYGGYYYNGLIDEVRLYNRVLSATEIANLYRAGGMKINSSRNNLLTNGLVGLWSFDGPDIDWGANIVYDRSGQGNNGQMSDLKMSTSPVGGKIGQAYKFKFQNITVPDHNSLDLANTITISLWLKPIQPTTGYAIHPLAKWSSTTDANFVLYYFGTWAGATPALMFLANRGGTWSGASAIYSNPTLNEWIHIGWTYDSSTGGQLYINGSPYGAFAGGGGVLATNNAAFYMQSNESPAEIEMDDVRIYNRVLTAAEMKQLYNFGR